MKHITYLKTLIFLFSGLFLFSCNPDKEYDLDNHTTLDNANSQSMFDDLVRVTEDALANNGANNKIAAGTPIYDLCATININVISSTHKIFTITFDSTACNDLKVRDGVVVAELTGAASFNDVGAVLTVKTDDYSVNGVKVVGKKILTCTAGCPSPEHTIQVSDTSAAGNGYASITYPSGETAYWKSSRKRTLVSGGCDADITNNIYDISYLNSNPVAEGINREGRSYSVDITSPIRVNFNCYSNLTARYPTQGVLVLKPDGKEERSIDYGDGTCDNKVTLKIGSFSKEVTLVY